MASSKGKARYPGPRFCDYLNGLRDEFDEQSNSTLKSTGPRRFDVYLHGLKCEFELMTGDIESLRKERDEFKAKVEAKALELRNLRNNVVCQRCNKGTTSKASVAVPSSSSAPVVLSKSLQKPKTFSLIVNLCQTLRWLAQRMTVVRKGHLQTVIFPSRLLHVSASSVNPASGPEESDRSTTFDHNIGNEHGIEMTHALSHTKTTWCVKFSPDGKYLATGCEDGKTYIYEVQTGNLICVLRDLLAKEDDIRAVSFSHDGKYIATGSKCTGINIWEINTKRVRNTFKGRTRWICTLDFSPNGRMLVATSDNNTVRLWNMHDGVTKDLTDSRADIIARELSVGRHRLFDPYYTSAVFNHDGRHAAASHRDGMVRVWHVRTGQLMRRVKAHMGIAYDIGFTPDGKGLVTGGKGDTLKYWDISTLNSTLIRGRSQASDLDRSVYALKEQTRPEREYSGHKDSIYCVAISPDGGLMASGCFDKTLGIWDTRSGAMQYSFNHNDLVYSIDFSPAGDHLASAERDGTVRVWRVIAH